MDWCPGQADFRKQCVAKFDALEVDRYDASVGRLGREDQDAYLSDLLTFA